MDCGIFWAICFAFALGLYLVALLIGACGLVIIADLLALVCIIGLGLSVLGLIGMFLSILIGIVKLVSLVVKGICTAIYNAAIWLIAFITSFVSE